MPSQELQKEVPAHSGNALFQRKGPPGVRWLLSTSVRGQQNDCKTGVRNAAHKKAILSELTRRYKTVEIWLPRLTK
jgi:hypothetical protein